MKATTFSILFVQQRQISSQVYSFHFLPKTPFIFLPGQYIQITLPHDADEKGTMRYFSLASAPSENELMIVTKLTQTSFKKRMLSLKPGDIVNAFGPIGKFTLED